MSSFFGDIDTFVRADYWLIDVQECMGEGALAFEDRTRNQTKLSDSEFRNAYGGIYQTIDGRFIALIDGQQQCRLDAIDSSYWEIYGSPELEAHMLAKYGAYHYQGA